jgi:uncharacterized SAM-binding protein YcdF (DUF218 family)
MSFVLSKILGILFDPATLLLLVFGAGLILLAFAGRHPFSPLRKLALRLLVLASAAAILVAVFPLGLWLTAQIENRFPIPQPMPQRVDGVIVLGGFIDPVASQARGRASVGGSIDRLFALLSLARAYPQAKLVVTGGSGSLLHPDASEAPVVRQLLADMGFPIERVIFEGKSRNTVENAVFSKEMINPAPGETWLLVTSAAHMARSVSCFRKAGWEVVAYPVDWRTWPGQLRLRFDLVGGLSHLGSALHELYGLAAYYMLGRTSEIFPSP